MTDHAFAPLPHELAAILDDRQTQFRRLIDPQPASQGFFERDETWSWPEPVFDDDGMSLMTSDQIREFGAGDGMSKYAAGDRLWMQEAWRTASMWDAEKPSELGSIAPIQFEADGQKVEPPYWGTTCEPVSYGKGRPSIHMPRWASRLTLVVTDVRVQRLQDINRGDAMQEGCPPINMADGPNPKEWFRDLWKATYGPDAWDQNPWVVATTFTVHHCNIDKMGEAQ